jgi:hypothetical protein
MAAAASTQGDPFDAALRVEETHAAEGRAEGARYACVLARWRVLHGRLTAPALTRARRSAGAAAGREEGHALGVQTGFDLGACARAAATAAACCPTQARWR